MSGGFITLLDEKGLDELLFETFEALLLAIDRSQFFQTSDYFILSGWNQLNLSLLRLAVDQFDLQQSRSLSK